MNAVEKFGGLQSVSSAQVLMDIYESYFALYNHLDPKKPNRPFASVALHPGEALNYDNNRLERSMQTYKEADIKGYFDLSYLDFMELPMNVVKTMLKVARQYNVGKNKREKEIEEAVRNGMQPPKS